MAASSTEAEGIDLHDLSNNLFWREVNIFILDMLGKASSVKLIIDLQHYVTM